MTEECPYCLGENGQHRSACRLSPTPYGEALERIASSLEEIVARQRRPRNEKRIRVRVIDPDEYLVEMQIPSLPFVVGSGFPAIQGQPGLFRDEEGQVINARDEEPQHRVVVNRRALCCDSLKKGPYLVTVDLQRDFLTWRWRDWLAL